MTEPLSPPTCIPLHLTFGPEEDWDSDGASFQEPFLALEPAEREQLDPWLAAFGLDSIDLLYRVHTAALRHGFFPWAVILLPQERRLAGHVAALRAEPTDVLFTGYSVLQGYDPQRQGPPPVSMILVRRKDILAALADQSPLFANAWEILQECRAADPWLCLAPLPDEAWLREIEVHDRDLFWRNVTAS